MKTRLYNIRNILLHLGILDYVSRKIPHFALGTNTAPPALSLCMRPCLGPKIFGHSGFWRSKSKLIKNIFDIVKTSLVGVLNMKPFT